MTGPGARSVVVALAAVLAVALPPRLAAQAPAGQSRDALRLLDYWLDAQAAYDRVPALAAGVVIDQELVWAKGYGTVDGAGRVPVTADTLYSICSISKLFTTIAALRLWEDGKVALDDDVARYVPTFAVRRTDPDSGPISLRMLLTHASGLPREPLAPLWDPPDYRVPDRARILADVARQETLSRAGDRYQYSNLGMFVVGEVIADVAAMPYADYVRDRVLMPLGLADTVPLTATPPLETRMPYGYTALKRDGTRDRARPIDPRGMLPVLGYASNVDDLARFASWQFRLLAKGGSEVLRVSTLREMQRVQWTDPDGKNTWGYGYAVTREGANTVVSHAGKCPGYETAIALALQDRVAVISLGNAQNAGPYTRPMRQLVIKGLRLPLAPTGGDAPDLESFAGRYGAQPWGSERVIVPWGRDLAILTLPSGDPAGDLSVLRHVARDTFRFVRDDGSLGAPLTFERDANGRVARFVVWNYTYPRVAP